jgi:hypothetical protein
MADKPMRGSVKAKAPIVWRLRDGAPPHLLNGEVVSPPWSGSLPEGVQPKRGSWLEPVDGWPEEKPVAPEKPSEPAGKGAKTDGKF